MAKKDHTGTRRKRKEPFRTPDLGYYMLITDAKETERLYFNGLKKSLPEEIDKRLAIKIVTEKDLEDILNRCEEIIAKHPQFAIPWLIIDCDQVKDFDGLVVGAKQREINVGWSNPCIEIWFWSYFEKPRIIDTSVLCYKEFKKVFKNNTEIEYDKANSKIYELLTKYGDEMVAINRAKNRLETSKRKALFIHSSDWVLMKYFREL